MKNKTKALVLFLVCIFLLFINNFGTSASQKMPLPDDTYVIHVPVNSSTKVYIEPKLVMFVEENGITVYKEKAGWSLIGGTTYKYYYIADKFVDKIVGTRELDNSIDSLIFIVNELENEAKKYDENNYKNLVLGYIRTISSSYDASAYGSYWNLLAGANPTEFIEQINSDYSHGIRIVEYFAQFVDYADYNEPVHGFLPEKYRKEKKVLLKDSLDNVPKIDLLHLIAAIDGIYYSTGNSIGFGHSNAQRDVLSWNGDLQTEIRRLELKVKDGFELPIYINRMNFFFKDEDSTASEGDIIADIDAMNITKAYIDMDDTNISDALGAYYLLVEKSPQKRFQMFMKTVLIDEENPFDGTEIQRFEIEVYSQFNLKKVNGAICDFKYQDSRLYVGFGLMRTETWTPANLGGDFPSFETRAFVTNSFIDYVVRSSR